MKVLLIQSFLGRKEQPMLPLGLAYLARYLAGHEVSILDPNIADDPFNYIRKRLAGFMPEVIGLSLRNIDTTLFKDIFLFYKTLEPTVELIKEVVPNSRLIIGGPGFSLFAEEIMKRNSKVDFGVYLEGEEALPELLNNLSNPANVKGIYYRLNGNLLFTGLRSLPDFENTLTPRRDLLELSRYQNPEGIGGIGVQSKRGCSLKCAYCTYPFLTGRTMRLRSPQKVVDEIEELTEKHGIAQFMFTDTVFNLPKRHAVEICEEIVRRKIATKWAAYFSLKAIDGDFIKLAYDAGCNAFMFSPDGYSNKSLAMLNKEINKNDIKKAYKMIKKLELSGAKFDFSFFINAPGQNYATFFAVLWLLLKTNFLLPRRKFMNVSVNIPRIEPNTDLYKLSLKEGTLSQKTNLLPFDDGDLPSLYYRNPKTKFVERIYELLLRINKTLKNIRQWRV